MAKACLQAPSIDLSNTEASSYQDARQLLKQDPAFDQVFTTVYKELCRVAASLRRKEEYSTLATAEIVSEAYMKLVRSPALAAKDPVHFKRIAAIAMRQILIDAAHRRRSLKRGGGLIRVTLSDAFGLVISWDEIVLDLDRLLDEFGGFDPRAAEAVEMHFFGGFTVPETAAYLKISESSVVRDLNSAIAWLRMKMKHSAGERPAAEPA